MEEQVRRLESRLQSIENQSNRQAEPNSSGSASRSSSSFSVGQISNKPSGDNRIENAVPSSLILQTSLHNVSDWPQISIGRARQLWSVYLADIEPLLKIVNHEWVEEALAAYPGGPSRNVALLNAVLFATVACKTPHAITEIRSLAKAVEMGLQTANVLSLPTEPTLQAMTLYLMCGRGFVDQDYIWTMLPLLVRLATKLRYDRDPEDLGYLPPESDRRRRLWWHIVGLDVQTAKSGGSDPMISLRQVQSVRLPSMAQCTAPGNNTNLSSMMHAPDMFLTAMRFELTRIARQVLFDPDSEHEQKLSNQTDRIAFLGHLEQSLLGKYINQCDCDDSAICRFTIEWATTHLTQLRLLVRHPHKIALRQITEGLPLSNEIDLLPCARLLERVDALRSDTDYSKWAWVWQDCVEWDAAAIALCAIASKTCTLDVLQRAWAAVDRFFDIWSGGLGDSAHERRWRELRAFRDLVRAPESDGPLSALEEIDFEVMAGEHNLWS